MTSLKIDFDRDIMYEVTPDRRPRGGVVIRRDPQTGSDVFMYRQDPGIYYSANGIEVSATMAARAGFDTEKHRKEREKRQKMQDFQARWEDDHKDQDRRVIEVRGDYSLVFIVGLGYHVEHSDGTIMTLKNRAQTEEMGRDWLTDFAGPAKENANVDVPGTGGQSEVGADRRAGEDVGPDTDVRKPGNKKASVPARLQRL